jgi:hypothetical protein
MTTIYINKGTNKYSLTPIFNENTTIRIELDIDDIATYLVNTHGDVIRIWDNADGIYNRLCMHNPA